MKAVLTALPLFLLFKGVHSWSSTNFAVGYHHHRKCIDTRGSRIVVAAKESLENDGDVNVNLDVDIDETTEKPFKAEYGVSYIGGDPCGSKYNDDPFDAQVTKPGMPDDMKARIKALAEKKKKENKENSSLLDEMDGN